MHGIDGHIFWVLASSTSQLQHAKQYTTTRCPCLIVVSKKARGGAYNSPTDDLRVPVPKKKCLSDCDKEF